VIIRGLRFRLENCPRATCEALDVDGFQINYGKNIARIVVDHCSFSGGPDENVGFDPDVRDVTLSWNIFGSTQKKNVLAGSYHNGRISIHHNLFTHGSDRNPRVSYNLISGMEAAPEISADIRNNLVVLRSVDSGTVITGGAKANVINNYYHGIGGAEALFLQNWPIVVTQANPPASNGETSSCLADFQNCPARAYVKGNTSSLPTGIPLDGWSTETQPYPAAPVTTTDACTAATQVRLSAGARGSNFGLDSLDQSFVSQIILGSCSTVSPAGPSNLRIVSQK
jgi:hypothetical protein